jgi:hypothetical protein
VSLPEDIREVLARVKAAGMKCTRSNVSRVRSLFRKKPKVNKADLVRAYPDLPAREIVEKAAAVGIKFDTEYVYTVRGYDRRKGVGAKGKPSRAHKQTIRATSNGPGPPARS